MRDHLTLIAAILAAANHKTGYQIQEETGMKPSTFDSKTAILLKAGAVEEGAGGWSITPKGRRLLEQIEAINEDLQ
jgi:predicted transcriptional regulator